MSRSRTSEAQYALFIFIIATVWAFASFLEHSYLEGLFKHTSTSGLLLSAGARLFLILAFRWRGAFAVAALMIAYKFHDGAPELMGASVLLMGLLWGVVPWIVMEITTQVWQIDRSFQKLKRNHLFLYAATDSFAVIALSMIQLLVYRNNVSVLSLWLAGAIAGTSNFLGIVLLMSIAFFMLKFYRRLQ